MEFEKLCSIISEVIGIDESEIQNDSKFIDDLGADSLDIFQIIMGIEEEFNIEISNEDAEGISTVGDALEKIKEAIWFYVYFQFGCLKLIINFKPIFMGFLLCKGMV